jgi:hypothetical protein
MYTIRRVSTVPKSPLRVVVDQPQGKDAGFGAGGSFYFYPAGSEDGPDQFGVTEHTARTIMGDRGLAVHFSCSPALPGTEPAASEPEEAAEPAQDDAAPAIPAGRRARKRQGDD